MDWQPIKTAPKDGTQVLAYCARADWDVGEDCSSPRSATRPFATVIYWDSGEWMVEQDFHMAVTVEPTHWMPLPPPPY